MHEVLRPRVVLLLHENVHSELLLGVLQAAGKAMQRMQMHTVRDNRMEQAVDVDDVGFDVIGVSSQNEHLNALLGRILAA